MQTGRVFSISCVRGESTGHGGRFCIEPRKSTACRTRCVRPLSLGNTSLVLHLHDVVLRLHEILMITRVFFARSDKFDSRLVGQLGLRFDQYTSLVRGKAQRLLLRQLSQCATQFGLSGLYRLYLRNKTLDSALQALDFLLHVAGCGHWCRNYSA